MGQLAAKIRAKYPGAYDDLSDADLEQKILVKYPQYQDLVEEKPEEATPPVQQPRMPTMQAEVGQYALEGLKGAAKGFLNTTGNLGQLLRKVPGVNALDNIMTPIPIDTTPTNTAQKVGYVLEQGAEYVHPATRTLKAVKATPVLRAAPKLAQRVLAEGASAAAVSAAQGNSTAGNVAAGTIAGAIPVVGAGLRAGARVVTNAALKPAQRELKRMAGDSLSDKVDNLTDFVLEKKITTPTKARSVTQEAEKQVTKAMDDYMDETEKFSAQAWEEGFNLSPESFFKDNPGSYISAELKKLRARLSKQALPQEDLKTVEKVLQDFVEAGGADRGRYPQDALELARATAARVTGKTYTGEITGAGAEAQKAIEQGWRNYVKANVPATRTPLSTQHKAIAAEKVLDQREYERSKQSAYPRLTSIMAGGGFGYQTGSVWNGLMVTALTEAARRVGGVRAGILMDAIGKAAQVGDEKTLISIAHKLGIRSIPGAVGHAMTPGEEK